jgi:hypothetical protein
MAIDRFDREDLTRLGTAIPCELHAAARAAALAAGTRFWLWVTEALEEYLAAVCGAEDDDAGRR